MSANLYPNNWTHETEAAGDDRYLPGFRGICRVLTFVGLHDDVVADSLARIIGEFNEGYHVELSDVACGFLAERLGRFGELYAMAQAEVDAEGVLGGTRENQIMHYMEIIKAFREAADAGGGYIA